MPSRTHQAALCLLVIMLSLTPLVIATPPTTQTTTHPLQNDIVFTHHPANGLYWNSHKLANFPAPFYLRLRGGKLTEFGGNVTGSNISRVELYAEGTLMKTFTQPPYSWDTGGMHVRIFGSTPTLTAKVYLTTGGVLWDNMTIYRLF